MQISRGKSKTSPKNGLASVWRYLRSSKRTRGIRWRIYPRTTPIPSPKSIRMISKKKKKKKKSETHPTMVKKTPLLMRRLVPKEPGKENKRIPWRKISKPRASYIGKRRGIINPKS